MQYKSLPTQYKARPCGSQQPALSRLQPPTTLGSSGPLHATTVGGAAQATDPAKRPAQTSTTAHGRRARGQKVLIFMMVPPPDRSLSYRMKIQPLPPPVPLAAPVLAAEPLQ